MVYLGIIKNPPRESVMDRLVVEKRKPRVKSKPVVHKSPLGEHSFIVVQGNKIVKLQDPGAEYRKPYLAK